MSTATLQELLAPVWAAENPQTLTELVHAKFETLDDTARDLRKQVMDVVRSFERQPLLNARSVRETLERHHLPVKTGQWNTFALDANREKVFDRVEARDGHQAMRLRKTSSRRFPTIEKLREKNVTLPDGGRYLIVYAGGTQALDEDALSAYRNLTTVARVADVLLWDSQDDAATFWSIKAGCGARGSERVEFPDQDTLRRWQES